MAFRFDGSLNDPGTGVALQGVEVYVLTQPANDSSFPPSPLATLYTDATGTVVAPNPVISDGYGNYYFYTAGGFYTLYIYDPLGRVYTEIFPDQEVGSPSVESSGGIVSVLSLVGQTGNISGTLFAVPATGQGMYRVTVDLICTTAGFSGGISATIGWNNGTTSASATSYQPLSTAVQGELAGQSEEFYAAAGSNITYSTTVTGGAGSVYSINIRLEYIEAVTQQFFTTYVQSINGISSLVGLVAGTNMSITQIGQNLVLNATAGGINPPAGDIGGSSTTPLVVSTHLTSPLPVAQGGTGTASPGLIAGTNVTITGTWPNQTINSSGGGGGGGISFNLTSQNANFAAAVNGDYQVTTAAATIIATLPTAVGNKNAVIWFQKLDNGSGSVVITPVGGQTIMGFATFSLISQYQFMGIVSDGSNWQVWTRN